MKQTYTRMKRIYAPHDIDSPTNSPVGIGPVPRIHRPTGQRATPPTHPIGRWSRSRAHPTSLTDPPSRNAPKLLTKRVHPAYADRKLHPPITPARTQTTYSSHPRPRPNPLTQHTEPHEIFQKIYFGDTARTISITPLRTELLKRPADRWTTSLS